MKPQSVDAIVQRVRGEYLEMPGLSLTEHQAQRLWHLEPEACRSLFSALVESGFLRQTPRGRYIRANVG
jgi:Spy/CpxP family protein refolding chaperone